MQVSAFGVLGLGPALLEGVPFPIQLSDIQGIDDKAALHFGLNNKLKLVRKCLTHQVKFPF